MQFLLISAALFFIFYFFYSMISCLKQTDKVPESISMTFYNVPIWLFVLFLLYSCGTISVINLTIKTDSFILSNLGAWFLAGVGFMSNIKKPWVRVFHMFGAIGGFSIILLGLWVDYGLWYIFLLAAVCMFLAWLPLRKKYFVTWIVEIVAIAWMLAGYAIIVFQYTS